MLLILSLNNFFGSSLRELGISFHRLTPILEKAFVFQVLRPLCKKVSEVERALQEWTLDIFDKLRILTGADAVLTSCINPDKV